MFHMRLAIRSSFVFVIAIVLACVGEVLSAKAQDRFSGNPSESPYSVPQNSPEQRNSWRLKVTSEGYDSEDQRRNDLIAHMAEQIRIASGEERTGLESELRDMLREQFDYRSIKREDEIRELELMLAELKQRLDSRRESCEQIIDLRFRELVDDRSLDWEDAFERTTSLPGNARQIVPPQNRSPMSPAVPIPGPTAGASTPPRLSGSPYQSSPNVESTSPPTGYPSSSTGSGYMPSPTGSLGLGETKLREGALPYGYSENRGGYSENPNGQGNSSSVKPNKLSVHAMSFVSGFVRFGVVRLEVNDQQGRDLNEQELKACELIAGPWELDGQSLSDELVAACRCVDQCLRLESHFDATERQRLLSLVEQGDLPVGLSPLNGLAVRKLIEARDACFSRCGEFVRKAEQQKEDLNQEIQGVRELATQKPEFREVLARTLSVLEANLAAIVVPTHADRQLKEELSHDIDFDIVTSP